MTMLRFLSDRLRFAFQAEFEFANRISRPFPSAGAGLCFLPVWIIGWIALWACGFPVDYLILGGFLAFIAGPAAIFLFFLVVGLALSLVPKTLVESICARESVVELPAFVEPR